MVISRRSLLTGLMGLVATTPAFSPVSNAAAGGVSPRMVLLIDAFNRCTAALKAIDYHDDPGGWEAAAFTRCRAVEALIDERPATTADFTAKFSALKEFAIEEDGDLVALRVLIEDAQTLWPGIKLTGP
jgi:hypothetical protein